MPNCIRLIFLGHDLFQPTIVSTLGKRASAMRRSTGRSATRAASPATSSSRNSRCPRPARAPLNALSLSINRGRKTYYELLERSNKGNEITAWLVYFAQTVLDAQAHSQELVEFLIAKTKFYDRLRGQLNERQHKAIARMMREGPGGFKGGLSAENYIRLTGTSRATATRDLQDLVQKEALLRTGTLKGTRYHLPIALAPVPQP